MISFPEMLFRLSAAIVLGGVVGFERERRVHTAGMRTNALVALGSAIFTLISIYGFLDYLGLPHVQVDPSRVASYVVAGIGFLGGGAIAFSRAQERVRGLTTAAAIWIVAAVGMACGAGFIAEAVAATILTIVVLIGLRYLERWLLSKPSSQAHRLRLETSEMSNQFAEAATDICTQLGMSVHHLEMDTDQGVAQLELVCVAATAATIARALGQLQALPGVSRVQADLERELDEQEA
jgi:putative Mg2+ transporter-C (MgtC) family protein